LSRVAGGSQPQRTLRFVASTNEETPFTRTEHMGSRIYARACRENGDQIVGMLCLEMLGSYSEQVGSQWLSFGGLLLPRRGNFLVIVGNRHSRPLLDRVSATLRAETSLRFRALTLASQLPEHPRGVMQPLRGCFYRVPSSICRRYYFLDEKRALLLHRLQAGLPGLAMAFGLLTWWRRRQKTGAG